MLTPFTDEPASARSYFDGKAQAVRSCRGGTSSRSSSSPRRRPWRPVRLPSSHSSRWSKIRGLFTWCKGLRAETQSELPGEVGNGREDGRVQLGFLHAACDAVGKELYHLSIEDIERLFCLLKSVLCETTAIFLDRRHPSIRRCGPGPCVSERIPFEIRCRHRLGSRSADQKSVKSLM